LRFPLEAHKGNETLLAGCEHLLVFLCGNGTAGEERALRHRRPSQHLGHSLSTGDLVANAGRHGLSKDLRDQVGARKLKKP
jgi:hypothetical protein